MLRRVAYVIKYKALDNAEQIHKYYLIVTAGVYVTKLGGTSSHWPDAATFYTPEQAKVFALVCMFHPKWELKE